MGTSIHAVVHKSDISGLMAIELVFVNLIKTSALLHFFLITVSIAQHTKTFKYGFTCIGTSIAFPEKKFKSAGLSFMVYHQISKNELYKILYDISTKLLIEINSDEKLHKYMTNFPFELENISIIVFFQESPGKLFYHPNLDLASLAYGTYNFSTVNPENENCYESEIHEKFDVNLIK